MQAAMLTPHPSPPFVPANLTARLEVESFSHVGLRRENNEDAVLTCPEASLFAVCDGIGGYSGGEVAAALTVETLQACSKSWPRAAAPPLNANAWADNLLEAIHEANRIVLENARRNHTIHDMCTTVVACALIDNVLVIGWLGDSRLYLQRGSELYLLTEDHSVPQWMGSEYRLVLSKYVGFKDVQPSIKLRVVQPGDVILLCSDGLYGEVDDDTLAQELAQVTLGTKTLANTTGDLLAAALRNGGKDNVSAVLLRVL